MIEDVHSNTETSSFTMRTGVDGVFNPHPAMVMAYIRDNNRGMSMYSFITPAAAREFAAQLFLAADEADNVNVGRES